MKKFSAILLLLLLLFTSCTAHQGGAETSRESANDDTTQSDSAPSGQFDYDLKTCNTIAEYNQFVEEWPFLPDGFLHYNDISYLGEFHRFTYLSNIKMDDYSHYLYTLVDSNDYELMVYVHEGPDDIYASFELEEITDIDTTDMRYLGSEKNAFYYQGEIGYSYSRGKLTSIYWMQNGWEIRISGNNGMLEQYPLKETSVMGKLLNK